MESALNEIWGDSLPVNLDNIIRVPSEFSRGVARCNIQYGPGIKQVTFLPYEKRVIRSLKTVISPDIDYHLKYTDRSHLDILLNQRGSCDDIIIVKNGLVTDTSMSNLAFFDGKQWFTPAEPLLHGTCRNRLLAEGQIATMEIHLTDLPDFFGCTLINAMRDLQEEEMIPVSNIFPPG
jgi:4-amino-4-deoxychorismate lyase